MKLIIFLLHGQKELTLNIGVYIHTYICILHNSNDLGTKSDHEKS